MAKKLSQDEANIRVNIRCSDANYKINEPFIYTNNRSIISLVCENDHEFKIKYFNFINLKQGCSYCAGNRKFTQEFAEQQVNQVLDKNNHILLNEFKYTNNKTILHISCHCGYDWFTQYSQYVTLSLGCAKCAGNIKFTQSEANHIIEDICLKRKYNFEPFVYKNSMNTKLNLICEYGHKWTAVYNDITNNSSGCPECKGKIHDILYIMTIFEHNIPVGLKFGIASRSIKSRLRYLNMTLEKYNAVYGTSYTANINTYVKFHCNFNARNIEKTLTLLTPHDKVCMLFDKTFGELGGSYTETRPISYYDLIISKIEHTLKMFDNNDYTIKRFNK